ncbi:MAG: sulfatase-like hydrolase/transferase [Bacteroidota bacterium]
MTIKPIPIIIVIALSIAASHNPWAAVKRPPEKILDPKRPNIIFILADDLGYGDLSCYGHPYSITPNLDALAEDGIKLKSFYTAGVTCAPSRTAFMTGRYPNDIPGGSLKNRRENVEVLTNILKNCGYATGHMGKWHMGPLDESFGIDSFGQRERERIDINNKDQNVFDRALSFIQDHTERPFYLNIWTHSVHFPVPEASTTSSGIFDSLEVDKDKFGEWYVENKLNLLEEDTIDINRSLINYLSELYQLDAQVGRLLAELTTLGLEENTIVVFSSDHGPGKIDLNKDVPNTYNMLGYSGGYRGEKHSTQEGGVKVPFIVRWPERIDRQLVDSTSVVSAIDFLPSICAVLDLDISNLRLQGEDKSSVFLGEPEERQSPLFWYVRSKTSILSGQWKMYETEEGNYALYNLREDPFEQREVSGEYLEIVTSLRNKMEEWKENILDR